MAEDGVTCLLIEPQLNASLVATVVEDFDVKTGTIDLLGANVELGTSFYTDLMRSIAASASECLSH